jgi:four helix bundle protein
MKYTFDLRERAYCFSVKVIKYFRPLYNDRYFRSMIDQLRDSATSVSANLQESKHSKSTKEYARYHEIALKSGNETIHWLNLLKDTMDIDASEINKMKIELEEILRVLAATIITLRKKKN